MRHGCLCVLAAFLFLNGSALYAKTIKGGEHIVLQDLQLVVPDGWELKQNARDGETLIIGFAHDESYTTLYIKKQSADNLSSFLTGEAKNLGNSQETYGDITWQTLNSSRYLSSKQKTYYGASFLTELNGHSYLGFTRASSLDAAKSDRQTILQQVRRRQL